MGYYDVDKANENVAPRNATPTTNGFNSVGDYQLSGLPWLTASVITTTTQGYGFQKVARFIHIINHAAAGTYLRIGFTEAGVNLGNYILLDGQKDIRLDYRVNSVFLKAHTATLSCSLAAGLTGVDSNQMPVLTGSAGSSPIGGAWLGVG